MYYFFHHFSKVFGLAKLKKLGSILVLVALILCSFGGCKSQKSAQFSDKKAKTSWFSKIFGRKKRAAQLAEVSASVRKVIETARSYRGTPHRDGGVNRMGIDCSALMQVSFQSAGLKIPRTARQQSEIGRPIDRKNLLPGDLVFFSDPKIGKGITHVGLVTEVDNSGEIKFIHTSSRLGVTENLLSTAYFEKTYAKAVRPF